jgi:hypothetical protein
MFSNCTSLKVPLVSIIILFVIVFSFPASSNADDNTRGRAFVTLNGQSVVAGEILVGFKKGASAADRKFVHTAVAGNQSYRLLKHFNFSNIDYVKLSEDTAIQEAVDYYQTFEAVLFAEPNFCGNKNRENRVYLKQDHSYDQNGGNTGEATTPNDTYFSQQWALKNTGQYIPYQNGTSDADIDATEAWDVATGNTWVVIGIIDTGIDYNHPDLINNLWFNSSEVPGNLADDDLNGYVDDYYGYDFYNDDGDPMDQHGNGTMMAGIIGADANNSQGVAGVAWHVRIIALKAAGTGRLHVLADIIEAINYATMMNVDILVCPYNFGTESASLKTAIENFGKLYVASVGNDNQNLDYVPYYPIANNLSNVISVSATDNQDSFATNANHGASSVDLCAPGEQIFTTFYDIDDTPASTYSWSEEEGADSADMAAAHVAGTAVLMRAQHQYLNAIHLKQWLIDNVDVLPGLSGWVESSGRLNSYYSLLGAKNGAVKSGSGLFSGTADNLTAEYFHSGRENKFNKLYLMINTSKDGSNCAYFYYDRDSNTLSLRSNGDNAWTSGTVGQPGYLANGQVSVKLQDVVFKKQTKRVCELKLPLTFTSGFKGIKNIYMYAKDTYGQNTGWTNMNTFEVTTSTVSYVPVNLGLNPTSSSGPAKKFTVTFRDGNGWRNIKNVYFMIDDTKDGVDAVYLLYAPGINTLYMRNDANSSWTWGTVGTSQLLSNSQGRINLADVTVTRVGYDVTLEFTVGFESSFNGSKNIYLFARDRDGGMTGWEKFGEITVNK